MKIFTSETPITWGQLDLPLLGISSDWYRSPLTPPLAYSLVSDSQHLWFIATRPAPATVLAGAKPHIFTPELWKSDVAELFIAAPDRRSYLELNLAPNAAWWAAKFSSPRVPSPSQPAFLPHIQTFHTTTPDGSWTAAMSIPLAFLIAEISFEVGSPANITGILNSPFQTFHTVAKLPGAAPDFHQPAHFPHTIPVKLPEK